MFGDNVKRRRQQLGLSQAELAKKIGGNVKQPSIQQLEAGVVTHPRYMRRLLKVLQCTYEDLATGPLGSSPGGVREQSPAYLDPRTTGKVPLISWVEAGQAELAIDALAPCDAEEWLFCNSPHSAHTYALRVHGDSMTSPYGRSYPDGSIIFVDPEQRGGIATGDPIIAKINGVDAVTFKALARDDGNVYLKPLNPQYPMIRDEFRVLGKVIEKLETV